MIQSEIATIVVVSRTCYTLQLEVSYEKIATNLCQVLISKLNICREQTTKGQLYLRHFAPDVDKAFSIFMPHFLCAKKLKFMDHFPRGFAFNGIFHCP